MLINLQKAEFILSAAAPKDFLRDGLPQIAFAGRSNVGKSSVINRLLNRKNFARVGAAPGKTTHINYFKIDNAFYLVDLPGYGYAKVSQVEKDRWGRLMESYFADPGLMTLGVMIVDSRHKPTADDCTMAQLVIALTARMIPGLHVLCGARTPEQVLDNAGALNIKLDGADAVRMKWDVDAIS